MDKVRLGSTDVEITSIVFGAWAIGGWMWGGNDDSDAVRAIETSLDNGCTSTDTAPIYGFGHSEELIGQALKNRSRDSYELLTKFCLRWDTDQGEPFFNSELPDGRLVKIMKYAGKDGIVKEVENSLKRLQTDYIDLYQIHWPDETTPIDETMQALAELIQQGKIRAAGVSNYNSLQMAEAEKTIPIASNQVPIAWLKEELKMM